MNIETQPPPQHIKIAEAAQRIEVSKHFLVKEIEAGNLPVVRLAKKCVRVRVEDLEAYMRRHLFVGPPSNRKPVSAEAA